MRAKPNGLERLICTKYPLLLESGYLVANGEDNYCTNMR